jgi:hypothetical protein
MGARGMKIAKVALGLSSAILANLDNLLFLSWFSD